MISLAVSGSGQIHAAACGTNLTKKPENIAAGYSQSLISAPCVASWGSRVAKSYFIIGSIGDAFVQCSLATGLLAHFVDLLAKSDPSKIYLYYDLHGQDCLIACVTKTQFAGLKTAGIAFRPLN